MFNSLDPLHSYDPVEILKAIFSKLYDIYNSLGPFFKSLPYYLINIFAKFVVFSIFLSLALFILLIIYTRRYKGMKNKIMSKVLPVGGIETKNLGGGKIENPKWQLVLKDIESNDPGKWKLAIIEADIILEDLLNTLSLHGEGVGEKLKSVEKSDFDHLDEAWEAHKVRNAIAHGGSDFILNQREAKRIIELYKTVFDEFEMI